MRRLLCLLLFLCAAITLRAQDAPPAGAAPPPTTAAPGTIASTGAPTIANPAPAPTQPIAFSHKKHVDGAKMACNDCHEPSRNGATVAIPQPAKCMLCHAAIATDKPDIQRIADAAKNNQPIKWTRVYSVPSFVTFSHRTHTSAGSTCEDCHGPVAQREAIALEKDISMGGCISCHTQKAAPTGCETCHQINAMHQQPAKDPDAALVARLTHANPTPVSSLHRFLATTLAMPRMALLTP